MKNQLYDVLFNFYTNNSDTWSDDYIDFQALTEEGVNSLLSQLSNYGKVTPYNFHSPSKDFFVHLNKPEGSGLCFRISYSPVQNFTVDQMVKRLNDVLVDFIREETKIEGFL
jgi:hypothetical protein